MGDPLKKLAPGDRVGPGEGYKNVAWFNMTIDAIKYVQLHSGGLGAESLTVPAGDELWIANVSWEDFNFGAVSGIGAPVNDPSVVGAQVFENEANHYSAAPAASSPFALMLEPLPMSVLAAKLFPASRLAVKSVWEHCWQWRDVYFSPRTEFSFLARQLEAPSWN